MLNDDNNTKKTFARLLQYYANIRGKQQSDLVKDLKLSQSTVSNWWTGEKMPRMNNIQMLADYLGVEKSDLLEDKSDNPSQNTLSADEQLLISAYRSLTSDDKEKLFERIQELLEIKNFKNANIPISTNDSTFIHRINEYLNYYKNLQGRNTNDD